MMMTMSALPRLLNCTSSAVLSRAENASVWADAGHDDHEDLAELGDPEHEFAHLLGLGAMSEVKVAYDVLARTGRIIGQGDGRGYGVLGPFEIAGSVDVTWVDGDTVVVLDWKTGYRDVDPAFRNWQLWGYALALCAALGKSKARVMIVYTKLPNARPDTYDIDALELADFAARIAALHGRIPELKAAQARGEQLDTKEGGWCRYCPSKHVCPSKNGLLVQIAKAGLLARIVETTIADHAGSHGMTVGQAHEAAEHFETAATRDLAIIGDAIMTQERARAAYEQFARAEQIVSDAKKRLQTWVDENGPIDLGDGRMFGRYHRPGNEKLDGNVAVTAIRELVGEQAEDFEAMAVERSTSKAAIDRACKALGMPRGTKPKIERRIRDLGGSSRERDTYPYGEFDADRVDSSPKPEFPVDDVNELLARAG